jgi:hypothetical protein
MAGRVLVVQQRSVGDGDLTRLGVDRESAVGVVGEREGMLVRSIGVGDIGPSLNRSAFATSPSAKRNDSTFQTESVPSGESGRLSVSATTDCSVSSGGFAVSRAAYSCRIALTPTKLFPPR